MMESQNSGAESQTFDRSQPISDGAKVVGGAVDVVVAAADGGVMVELGSGRGRGEVVKRKRGRPPKAQAKPPPAKKNKEKEREKEEEDVCFICFDGGSLVLCDRRGCPKAYHPACIKRDEAFFESAAKWDCGWHICSICQKAAHHMCYTCTYSLCRSCIRKADYVCVRDKGFCPICIKTIMLIENNGQGEDGKVQADFDDKLSWEYLFKVYWVYLKGKLSITLDELTLAKNPWKEAIMTSSTPCNPETNESKRRKIDDKLHNETVNTEWATKELLDFVSHMKNGNTSLLSRFDVQDLLTEYVKTNNLQDPKRKNQIICDSRLKNLFGKSHVGRVQMLKILERHFFVKEDLRKRKVKSNDGQDDADWNPDDRVTVGKSRKQRNRSKGKEHKLPNKLDEFAAIDVHNMNLIYLRRDLLESLLEDGENFHAKVAGSIVRTRVSRSDQDHDMYRLVQVVGTCKVDAPYKIDSKSTDVMLEVLTLDKKETLSINEISDQELSEEECRRLQESIKCGLVKSFTVGEIQEKAVALREQEIPEVHFDPKMSPDYESDDTEEYFNKEHGDHMDSKYSVVTSKNSLSSEKKSENSAYQNVEPALTSGKFPSGVDCNGSTITKLDHQATLSSSVTNSEPEIRVSSLPAPSSGNMVWHYRDPNGKVQGPFSLVQLQIWSTTGYFPTDMRIWAGHEDKSVLLHDVLKEKFHNCHVRRSENVTPSSNPVNHEKSSDGHGSSGQSFGQNWNAPNESTGQLNTSSMPMATERNEADIKHVPKDANVNHFDLPDSKLLVQDSGNPPSWSSASSLVVGGAGLVSISSFKPLEVAGDHAATPTSNIDQNINPTCNDLPTWNGVDEMIEISTLAEESVSDLLAEVDAMESQYGLASPTSRRNSFVDDLFNGSFDEFSPTPDQGTRSDGFSSSGDIQLPCHSATEEHINAFDFMKISNGLQPHSFIRPGNIGSKWPETETAPLGMIDINRSAKAEGDDEETET